MIQNVLNTGIQKMIKNQLLILIMKLRKRLTEKIIGKNTYMTKTIVIGKEKKYHKKNQET